MYLKCIDQGKGDRELERAVEGEREQQFIPNGISRLQNYANSIESKCLPINTDWFEN